VAEHFLQEQRPTAVETLGLLVPDAKGEQQQGHQVNTPDLNTQTRFSNHLRPTRKRRTQSEA